MVKWKTTSAGEAFGTWTAQVLNLRLVRRAAKRAVERWRYSYSLAAFLTWSDRITQRLHLKRITSKIVTGRQQSMLSSAWFRWAAFISERLRLRRMVTYVMAKWKTSAFRMWQAQVVNLRVVRRAAKKGVARRRHSHSLAAFLSWKKETLQVGQKPSYVHTRTGAPACTDIDFSWLVRPEDICGLGRKSLRGGSILKCVGPT